MYYSNSKLKEYLESRVTQIQLITMTTPCWVWSKSKDPDGYGYAHFGGKGFSAHRLSYLHYHGNIKPKMHICHSCDNPSCINPTHLWQGTAAQNNQDKMAKGRAKAPKPPGFGLGNNNGCKLTKAEIDQLKEDFKAVKWGGKTKFYEQQASKLNVSPMTVANYCKGLLVGPKS